MTGNPFELVAEYECREAYRTLLEIADGRIVAPSVARKVSKTIVNYPNTFESITEAQGEQLLQLSKSLLDNTEGLFGYGLSGDDNDE